MRICTRIYHLSYATTQRMKDVISKHSYIATATAGAAVGAIACVSSSLAMATGTALLAGCIWYRHAEQDPLFPQHNPYETAQRAIQKGATSQAKSLIAKYPFSAKQLSNLLHLCADNSKDQVCEIAALLIKKGADVNFADPVRILKTLPLHKAVVIGNVPLCKLFLRSGAQINEPCGDETALHMAISGNNDFLETQTKQELQQRGALAEVLITNGAEVNRATFAGWTPVHYAANFGNVRALKALIQAGANVNYAAPGEGTPLHYACKQDQIEAVRTLIKAGADIHAQDQYNTTPLHCAAVTNSLKIAEILSKQGADMTVALSGGLNQGKRADELFSKENQKTFRANYVKALDKGFSASLQQQFPKDLCNLAIDYLAPWTIAKPRK